MKPETIQISVVVPLLNEQGSLSILCRQIEAVLENRCYYEIIFIDDGSTDKSFEILKRLQQENPAIRIIRFRRNFGQTAALSAGFRSARGQIIIALDADLQNDPADIPQMIEKINQGYDVVSGWRKNRKDSTVTRLVPSMLANRLIQKITGIKLHDFGCTLKAYRREIIDQINLYGEMHRFIPAIASWHGAKICEIVVNHRPRTSGVAKYGLSRTFKVALDLITIKFLGSFSTKPIYVFGGTGVLCGLLAIVSGFIVLFQKFLSAVPLAMNRNPLLVFTALMITASIQFILMGLLAEILVRIYHESQNRPTYVIRDIIPSHTIEH